MIAPLVHLLKSLGFSVDGVLRVDEFLHVLFGSEPARLWTRC